jgi:hypothetical protein
MDKKQIIEDYLQGRHPMEQHSWELPSAQELDNAEAEFDRISLTPRPLRKERGLKFWPLAIAACLAGFVVIFLAPPRTTEQPPLAMEEPTVNCQLSTVNSQEPRVESQQKTVNSRKPKANSQLSPPPKGEMEGASQLSTQPSPKGGDGGGLPTANSQQPIAEPLLAEAEINASHLGEVGRGALPEMKDPFLAIAQQMQDIRSRGEQVRQVVAQLIDNQVNLQ